MDRNKASSDRLKVLKFKLDSLLDITLSINANLPTEELLIKYELILRQRLGIGKIMIFKLSEKWECILNGGFSRNLEKIDVEKTLMDITDITFVSTDSGFEGVDIIVPVYNNFKRLAFVFIGDIEEEGEGMSPVLKHLNFIQTISNVIIVAIENIRLVEESLRQEALRKELELAARMQKMLIPDNSKMPKTNKFIINGFYYPHYQVGGDYYDCLRLSESKIGFCIADVSGKGISAAILMSNFQANLRALFTSEIKLETLITKLNTVVLTNAAGEKFITFFVARYDFGKKMLEYVNAAHNPPVLYNTETGNVEHLLPSCVGIGMLDEIPVIRERSIQLSDRSKIVCYTDGLSELKGEDGQDIGTAEIVKYISNMEPVEKNITRMMRDLGIPHTNPNLFDDVSIIAADLL
jgi:sigma-B regulation protein RsbU (phosphoserine phosphatase)